MYAEDFNFTGSIAAIGGMGGGSTPTAAGPGISFLPSVLYHTISLNIILTHKIQVLFTYKSRLMVNCMWTMQDKLLRSPHFPQLLPVYLEWLFMPQILHLT